MMQFAKKNIALLLVYIVAGLSLVFIINGLVNNVTFVALNNHAERWVMLFMSPALDFIMLLITNIANPIYLSLISVLLAILLLYKKETYSALLYVLSMLLGLISIIILKNFFVIARPDVGITNISGWSFPSGHSTIATIFFSTTAYSFYNWFKGFFAKIFFVIASFLGIVLVSFSRIYLGVHWTVDVLGGVALGFLCVSFLMLIFNIVLEEER